MTQTRQKTNNRGAGAAEILIQSLAKQQRQQKKQKEKRKKQKTKKQNKARQKKLRFGCLCGVKNYFQSFNLYFFNLKTSYVIVVMKYPLHVA